MIDRLDPGAVRQNGDEHRAVRLCVGRGWSLDARVRGRKEGQCASVASCSRNSIPGCRNALSDVIHWPGTF